LSMGLPHHARVEGAPDIIRLGQLVPAQLGRLGQLLLNDLVTELDAFVADVDAGTRDELLDLLLGFPAARTLQQVAAVADPCHRYSLGLRTDTSGRGVYPTLPALTDFPAPPPRGVSGRKHRSCAATSGDRPRTRSLARGPSPLDLR